MVLYWNVWLLVRSKLNSKNVAVQSEKLRVLGPINRPTNDSSALFHRINFGWSGDSFLDCGWLAGWHDTFEIYVQRKKKYSALFTILRKLVRKTWLKKPNCTLHRSFGH